MTKQDYRTSYLIRLGVLIYIFALSLIAAFSIAFHLLTDSIVHRQQSTAEIVNVSGRQRMLSERIAWLALERATHAPLRPDAETQAELRDTIRLMETSQDALLHGSAQTGASMLESPRVAEVYLRPPWQLQARVREFLVHAHAVAERPESAQRVDDPDLQALEAEARQPLLDALNAAVDAISRTSEEAIAHLRRVLAMLTLSTLAILGLEALFLYRPLFRRLERANRELILTGRTDSLTGCLNRRGFADEAQRMLAEARRDGTALGVVMIDIDRFKSINDTYGHAAGDQAIESIALTLGAHTRSNSVLCRMGGEEFAVILRDSTLHGARTVAERLRAAVEAVTLHLGRDGQGPTLQVTASFGVAALRKEDLTLFNTLSRADKALYRAKSQGRNRVECEPAEEDADAYARHSRS